MYVDDVVLLHRRFHNVVYVVGPVTRWANFIAIRRQPFPRWNSSAWEAELEEQNPRAEEEVVRGLRRG